MEQDVNETGFCAKRPPVLHKISCILSSVKIHFDLPMKRSLSLLLSALVVAQSFPSPSVAAPKATGEIQRIELNEKEQTVEIRVLGPMLTDYFPFFTKDSNGIPKIY